MEDFLTRIDIPLLDSLHTTFFDQATFDTPHLSQFISRARNFQELDEARVTFSDHEIVIALSSPTRELQDEETIVLEISRNDESIGQLLSRSGL